jgi:solute carrier family 10 (sodium/bile acid cotransporter), member 7
MSFKKLFLPVGLLLAIACALIAPQAGIWMKHQGFVPFFVVIIFLISGWKFNIRDAKLNSKFMYALLLALVISLLGGPFLGMGAVELFGFGTLTGLGLIVMCCVPVTLSSATVITELAKGNTIWSLLMTVVMNIVGIFSIPLMLKLTLEEAEGVSISAWNLLLKLILLVLLPFIAGITARKLTKIKTMAIVAYMPSTCVILTVYTASAASRKLLYESSLLEILLLIVAAFSIHLMLMFTAWLGGKALRLESSELKALIFVTSQKTLPIAISVLAILCDNPGAAIIPCLVFHFTQLFTDSALASRLGHMKTKI